MPFWLSWSYALRSLQRGGQRTVLAIFCVAVGIMAIVGLQLVGQSVNQALTGNIVEANGGDLRVDSVLLPFHQQDLATIESLKQQGKITAYATTYEIPASITLPDQRIVPFDLLAAAPNFPLVGQANFTSPQPDLRIQGVVRGDKVAISALVADLLGARSGDRYTLRTGDNQVLTVTVAAIFAEGGAFHGPQMIIAQETLFAQPGPDGGPFAPRYSGITITTPDPTGLEAILRQAFPTASVMTAADELRLRQNDVEQIRLFLRIVGLLALFIGGVGIVNTMQVLLRRRRIEIAMLKTLGYRQRDLYLLFGQEAALLGLAGSLVGVGLGIAAAFIVQTIVAQAFFLHLTITLDPVSLASGIALGIATALIFGLLPIVQASQVRPLAILRDEEGGRLSWPGRVGLLVLLSLLFVALATGILGDPIVAAEVVYGGVGAVGLLAGGFSLLVLVIARLPVFERPTWRMSGPIGAAIAVCAVLGTIPVILVWQLGTPDILGLIRAGAREALIGGLVGGGLWLALAAGSAVVLLATLLNGAIMFAPRGWKMAVMLAYRNIGRQRLRTTTTLTALFVGVFGIGAIVILGQGIKDAINSTIATLFSHNLFVIGSPGQPLNRADPAFAGLPGADDRQTMQNPIARIVPVTVGDRPLATILAAATTQTDSNQGIARRNAILLTLSIVEGFDLGQGQSANLPPITITSGRNLNAADAGTNAVVLNDILTLPPVNLRPGMTLVFQSEESSPPYTVIVVGFFSRLRTTDFIPGEVLADSRMARLLGGKQTLDVVALKIDPNQIAAARQQLLRALPGAQVVSLTDLNAIFDRVLNDLIIMLSAIASLALIAGLIIIANAVALAMLERRREIGILKSVGHTSRSILAMVLVENGLIGFLGALVAMTLVVGAILALAVLLFQRAIAISGALVGGVILGTVTLTLVIAALVAWGAVRVRPIEVLRYD